MKEKEPEFIISTEELKKNQEKIRLKEEMEAIEKAMKLNEKRALKIIAIIGIVLITIAITQLFYVKKEEVKENSIMICRGKIIEVCVTRDIK